jgi:hypothetical protein
MSLLRTCGNGTRAVIGVQGLSQYTVGCEWLQAFDLFLVF